MYHTFLSKYLSSFQSDDQSQTISDITALSQNPISQVLLSDDLGSDFALELSDYISGYKQDKNPTFLFKAVCLLHENQLYPPEFIMDKLYSVFKSWLESKGTKSLDNLFGTKKRGQKNRITREKEFRIIHKLMQEIWQLKNAFELTTAQAAEMVSRRLEEMSKKTKLPCKNYTIDTLIKYYDGKHGAPWRKHDTVYNILCFDEQNNQYVSKKIPMFKEWTQEIRSEMTGYSTDEGYTIQEWTSEIKSEILSRYPADSMPSELK
ncbi:MAG: hypothetical protein PVI75_00260 [Gammaproteobacteria bacterium]|jgi:hypothetical protein